MPTVPMSRENTVRTEALPGVRVDATQPLSAFGGGEALDRTAQEVKWISKQNQDFILKQQKDASDIRITAADLDLAKAQSDLSAKMKSMQGKDALGAPDVIEKEWKSTTDGIYKGLSNDYQRQEFNKRKSLRYADLYSDVSRHVQAEGQRYDADLTDAYVSQAQKTAADSFMDNDKVQKSLIIQEGQIRQYGDRHGVPKELTDARVAENISKTHTAVLEQMLLNKAGNVAQEYYQNNSEAINPDQRIKIKQAIDKEVVSGEADRKANELFAKYSKPNSEGYYNSNAAFEDAKDIKDDDLRKETQDKLHLMFTRQNLEQRATNQQNYQLASKMTEQGQPLPKILTQGLTPTQNKALTSRQKQINAGVQPNTDWTTYYNLKSMAADNKNEFSAENLLEYRHVLADSEFKELTGLQGQIVKNDPSAQTHLNGFRTTNQLVNDTLMSAGINVKSKDANNQKRVSDFKRKVDEHIQILQDQTGKKAKSEDVQKIVDNLLITAIKKRPGMAGIFDREKKAFEVEYKDVPDSDRQMIQDALKKRGRIATERLVVEYYLKGVETRKAKDGY